MSELASGWSVGNILRPPTILDLKYRSTLGMLLHKPKIIKLGLSDNASLLSKGWIITCRHTILDLLFVLPNSVTVDLGTL